MFNRDDPRFDPRSSVRSFDRPANTPQEIYIQKVENIYKNGINSDSDIAGGMASLSMAQRALARRLDAATKNSNFVPVSKTSKSFFGSSNKAELKKKEDRDFEQIDVLGDLTEAVYDVERAIHDQTNVIRSIAVRDAKMRIHAADARMGYGDQQVYRPQSRGLIGGKSQSLTVGMAHFEEVIVDDLAGFSSSLVNELTRTSLRVKVDNFKSGIVNPIEHYLNWQYDKQRDIDDRFHKENVIILSDIRRGVQTSASRQAKPISSAILEGYLLFTRDTFAAVNRFVAKPIMQGFSTLLFGRKREQDTLLGELKKQTEFMRTGKITDKSGLLSRFLDRGLIGSIAVGVLTAASGFYIRRGVAQTAEQGRFEGRELSTSEKLSSFFFKSVDRLDMTRKSIAGDADRQAHAISVLSEAMDQNNEYLLFATSLLMDIRGGIRELPLLSRSVSNLATAIPMLNPFEVDYMRQHLGLTMMMVDSIDTLGNTMEVIAKNSLRGMSEFAYSGDVSSGFTSQDKFRLFDLIEQINGHLDQNIDELRYSRVKHATVTRQMDFNLGNKLDNLIDHNRSQRRGHVVKKVEIDMVRGIFDTRDAVSKNNKNFTMVAAAINGQKALLADQSKKSLGKNDIKNAFRDGYTEAVSPPPKDQQNFFSRIFRKSAKSEDSSSENNSIQIISLMRDAVYNLRLLTRDVASSTEQKILDTLAKANQMSEEELEVLYSTQSTIKKSKKDRPSILGGVAVKGGLLAALVVGSLAVAKGVFRVLGLSKLMDMAGGAGKGAMKGAGGLMRGAMMVPYLGPILRVLGGLSLIASSPYLLGKGMEMGIGGRLSDDKIAERNRMKSAREMREAARRRGLQQDMSAEVSTLGGATAGLGKGILAGLWNLISGVGVNFSKMFEMTSKEFPTLLWNLMSDFALDFVDLGAGISVGVVNVVKTATPLIWSGIKYTVGAIVSGIKELIIQTGQAIADHLIEPAAIWLMGLPSRLWDWALAKASGYITQIGESMSDFGKDIYYGFESLIGQIKMELSKVPLIGKFFEPKAALINIKTPDAAQIDGARDEAAKSMTQMFKETSVFADKMTDTAKKQSKYVGGNITVFTGETASFLASLDHSRAEATRDIPSIFRSSEAYDEAQAVVNKNSAGFFDKLGDRLTKILSPEAIAALDGTAIKQVMGLMAVASGSTVGSEGIDSLMGGTSFPKIDPTLSASIGGRPATPSKMMGGMKMPSPRVGSAIDKVSEKFGVPRGLMYAMAYQESKFDPTRRAIGGASSATGLYQFLDKTWTYMLDKYGDQYPVLKRGRTDPEANATAAALYLSDNMRGLSRSNLPVNPSSIYATHMLGPTGAKRLYAANPNAPAASVLPSAARSNKNVFFKDGDTNRPKTVAEVQRFMYNKVGRMASEYEVALSGSSADVIRSPEVAMSGMSPDLSSVGGSLRSKMGDNLSSIGSSMRGMSDDIIPELKASNGMNRSVDGLGASMASVSSVTMKNQQEQIDRLDELKNISESGYATISTLLTNLIGVSQGIAAGSGAERAAESEREARMRSVGLFPN